MHQRHRVPRRERVLGTEQASQPAELLPKDNRVLGRELPHQPCPGHVTMRVLHRDAGLASATQTAQCHDPGPCAVAAR